MKVRILFLAITATSLFGCAGIGYLPCMPNCRSESHSSSSLVSFLYAEGKMPPREDITPELHIPLRIGLAFLPSKNSGPATGLEAAQREKLLEQIRQRFASRKFISEIVTIPDYYLVDKHGFEGLAGVQRLYNIDLMALVSYDQVTHLDDNSWSLGYLTIVGAYVVKGSRHDISTLVDLAIVDPTTRSLVLRAGGTDTRHGNTTLIDQQRETRMASTEGFGVATSQMIENFDMALTKFEADVRTGKANLRVINRGNTSHSTGGGAVDMFGVLMLLSLLTVRENFWRRYLSVASRSTMSVGQEGCACC